MKLPRTPNLPELCLPHFLGVGGQNNKKQRTLYSSSHLPYHKTCYQVTY